MWTEERRKSHAAGGRFRTEGRKQQKQKKIEVAKANSAKCREMTLLEGKLPPDTQNPENDSSPFLDFQGFSRNRNVSDRDLAQMQAKVNFYVNWGREGCA